MGGKIFANSSNLQEDKAKILFDYYKKAAETIVGKERAIEEKDEAATGTIETNNALINNKGTLRIVFIVLTCIILVGALIAFFIEPAFGFILGVLCLVMAGLAIKAHLERSRLIEENLRQEEIKRALQEEKDAIRRDYKVSRLGTVYVPIASSVPFEGKSFTIDHTGNVENTRFSISVLNQPDEFKQTLSELEASLESVPIVEGNESAETVDSSDYSKSIQNVTMHDYMGGVDRQIRKITYLLSDSERVNVSLPMVIPQSEADSFIDEFATEDPEGKTIVNVFDMQAYEDPLQTLSKLNEMKKEIEKNSSKDNSLYFKNLIKNLGESVQLVSLLKTNSVTNLITYNNLIFANVLKSPYNHYSPVLEAEEINRIRMASFDYQDSVEDYSPFNLKQSSRVKFDIFSFAWLAEDGSRTNMPFGMHQIQEEVLMPVINNLMNETRIERLKIYNHIKDQKMSYLNKWSQDIEAAFRDNRARGQELITEITNAYAEYNTAYQTYISYKETQDKMKHTGSLSDAEVQEKDTTAEQIVAFQAQANQCNQTRDEFSQFMDRLTEDIEAKTEKFGHIEFYEASLTDKQYRDVALSQSPETLQNLDERRKRLVQISSYYASFAKIPPEPSTEPNLSEDFMLDVAQLAKQTLDNIEEIEQKEAELSFSQDKATTLDESAEAMPPEQNYQATLNEEIIDEGAEKEEGSEDVSSSNEESINGDEDVE